MGTAVFLPQPYGLTPMLYGYGCIYVPALGTYPFTEASASYFSPQTCLWWRGSADNFIQFEQNEHGLYILLTNSCHRVLYQVPFSRMNSGLTLYSQTTPVIESSTRYHFSCAPLYGLKIALMVTLQSQ